MSKHPSHQSATVERSKRRQLAAKTHEQHQPQTKEPQDQATLLNQNNKGVQTEKPSFKSVSTQTDLYAIDISVLEGRAAGNSSELQRAMKTAERATINEQYFKDDDKVKFYTGLPTLTVLMAVFNFVVPKIPLGKILTPFQQLVLVLMKLKLNLKHKDLAFRFQVSEATVCRIFSLMLDILSTQLSPLITLPSRETLWKTMPMDFRKAFGKHVAVIIDCFEVFCVRPCPSKCRGKSTDMVELQAPQYSQILDRYHPFRHHIISAFSMGRKGIRQSHHTSV
ncbi:uncharacterized protein LOC119727250 [Patiria miniata]|uniref:Transposase Helix-turn-helix domain-containing protein n=1 Tax=Patiria miniata TaxID=46514 RepID=A0A913ZUA6_PATMI|nr:uncharacterized protein LOC119727250 [Patiria miniata]